MDAKYGETLSAFFDGEAVDPVLLQDSLAQPGAAALLAEFAEMRRRVVQDPARPSPESVERMHGILRRTALQRLLGERFPRLAVAASLMLIAGLGGFGLGRMVDRSPNPQPQPVATRVSVPASSRPAPERVTAAPQPAPPPGAASVPRTRARPTQAIDAPPAASLRLRLGQWQDAPPTDQEGRRRE